MELDLEPLMADQENDTRLSTGAIYWEGAVTAYEALRQVGRGYLELTGYGQPLRLRQYVVYMPSTRFPRLQESATGLGCP